MPAQRHFDRVAEELRDAPPLPGLWVRAYSDAFGDGDQSRALYIRYRAEELATEERLRSEQQQNADGRRAQAKHSLRIRLFGLRVGSFVLMLIGFALVFIAAEGLVDAVTEKELSGLVVAAVFGALGAIAINRSLAAFAALK